MQLKLIGESSLNFIASIAPHRESRNPKIPLDLCVDQTRFLSKFPDDSVFRPLVWPNRSCRNLNAGVGMFGLAEYKKTVASNDIREDLRCIPCNWRMSYIINTNV